MNKEKLQLTKEQGRDIIYGDNPNFEIIETNLVDHGRWTLTYEIVVQRKSDGKYFKDYYQKGATESQDESPYEYTNPNFTEVEKKEKVVIVYE